MQPKCQRTESPSGCLFGSCLAATNNSPKSRWVRFLTNLWGGGFAWACEPGLVFGDTDTFVWDGGAGRAPQVMDTWD